MMLPERSIGLRRPKNRQRGRRRNFVVALALALVALVAVSACSSSSKSATKSSSSAPSSASTKVAAANEVGISATEIKIGLIADVDTPVAPALYQPAVDAMNAWAKIVNAAGGLAGRKVVIDFCDSKLDANTTTNCVIRACSQDFALVATFALALSDTADISKCANISNQPNGIPNLAAYTINPASACAPGTFIVQGNGLPDPTFCQTLTQHPQTYTKNIGDIRYYLSNFTDLHGISIFNGDVPAIAPFNLPQLILANQLGIKADGQGQYSSSASATQSALTPIALQIKRSGSTYVFDGSSFANMVQLRREAALQGVTTVKVWGCNQACYDTNFLQQGGSDVNGTYTLLDTLPFLTEYQSNPALSKLVDQLGGVSKVSSGSVSAYLDALLFQDAVTKAVATGATLDRASLLKALQTEHSFDAEGIIGATDVAAGKPSPCVVIVGVVNGKWQRVSPAKAGTFDCSSDNIMTLQSNILK